jgi:hypothetical protein
MANDITKVDWNKIIKKKFTATDALIVAVNLIPLIGVWFLGWDAKEMFLVYCLETVIVGFYTILQLLLVTHVKKRGVFNTQTGAVASGYFFVFFFILHYGFFIFVQLNIFLSVLKIPELGNFGAAFEFLFHFPKYLSNDALLVLFSFILSYGAMVASRFVISGKYKTARLGIVMFSPYPRIIVQQIVVILGTFVLLFGAGASKVFMLIFVLVKIFFEIIIDYDRVIEEAVKSPANVQD